jgi:hypothetical protein
VKLVPQGLGQAMYAGKGVLSAETLPRALKLQQWVEFFLIYITLVYMIFDHPKHTLEGSRLNSWTCVVILVVMVASSHLRYLNFLFIYPQVRLVPHGLG